MSIESIQMEWVGIRPLIMHNGRLADPLDEKSKALSGLTKKRGKQDEDHEAIANAEWDGGVYWDDEEGPCIPADNIERCLQLGGSKNKDGKNIQAAVFVDMVKSPVVRLEYDGPRDFDKLIADPKFRLRKGVGVQKSRIMRTRPMFPTGWKLLFWLEYDTGVINEESIERAGENAGSLVGCGDWRPKFGRFISKIIK